MKVEYTLQRYTSTQEATAGLLFDNEMNFTCHIVEDQRQDVKVQDETRIPAGTYQIKNREVLSGMTKRYRETRDWFDWHLELQSVPNFQYVYIHNGVDSDSSSGCLICGNGVLDKYPEYQVTDSKKCFERVWKEISELLDQGYEVYITIRDEDYLKQPF